jgi:hypothetical protein
VERKESKNMFIPKIDFEKYPMVKIFLEDTSEMILSNENLLKEFREILKDYPIINSMLPSAVKDLLKERKVKV